MLERVCYFLIYHSGVIVSKGFFITFEGAEGAGKTTQIKMLKEYFEQQGRECIITREPGGTPVAEQLREIVKYHTGPEPIVDEAEVLLFAASRAQHVRNLIIPAIEEGKIVLCDRFYDSTLAYQGFARGQDIEFLKTITKYAICGCTPDITILLDLDPEIGFIRTRTREETIGKADRIEAAGHEFHQAVRQGFLTLAKDEPKRIKAVSADQNIDSLHNEIVGVVKNAIT